MIGEWGLIVAGIVAVLAAAFAVGLAFICVGQRKRINALGEANRLQEMQIFDIQRRFEEVRGRRGLSMVEVAERAGVAARNPERLVQPLHTPEMRSPDIDAQLEQRLTSLTTDLARVVANSYLMRPERASRDAAA
jgi:hypothetical protein